MDHSVISPKKLIEVALPLDAINAAAGKEKGNPFLKGHPRNLHQWWARRPFGVARAVIFAQMVCDPEDLWRCQNPQKEPNSQVKGHWTKTRARLFAIIEELVKWENSADERVLEKARDEIRMSWKATCDLNQSHPQAATLFDPETIPGLHDPFAGGGAIPLEALRLGLVASASDLNPVAVLINKAMIEIPSRFAGCTPIGPDTEVRQSSPRLDLTHSWPRASGLAEDVRRYSKWMRDEAERRIGHLYPRIAITKEMASDRPDLKAYIGNSLEVISWIWARTVRSPNPAFSHIPVPLVSTFVLCSKAGKEVYVEPIIKKDSYSFSVKCGKPPASAKSGTKAARGANFRCLMSQSALEPQYIKAEAMAGRMDSTLIAIVAKGTRGRVYISPTPEHEEIAKNADVGVDAAAIRVPIANDPRALWCLLYGLDHFDRLFTSRQLVALTTFSDLINEVRLKIKGDAIAGGMNADAPSLEHGGLGAAGYADAIAVYLAMVIDKLADYCNSLCTWNPTNENVGHLFSKQALPMAWDYPEISPFSSGLEFTAIADGICKSLESLPVNSTGTSFQHDSASLPIAKHSIFVSTDPPYYDNIGYADLSDFFYVWLRRSLRLVFPSLFATIAVPKSEELVATPYRHGSKEAAEAFFLDGMTRAMSRLAEYAHPACPVTIYYAFKQSETETDGTNSTGWETFLEAVNRAGLALTGTWPMRTERAERSVGQGTNSLASSIILVCRPRAKDATTVSRRQFIRELNERLPLALDAMTRESEGLHSPVAPVDLSQAIIGPGMAVFSQYAAVLEADGTPMTVKTALQLINRFLAEDDFDADTQFCLHWFEQYGWDTGKFGEADTLARAKGTSVDGVKNSGVLRSAGGNVRLLKWAEYPSDWDPRSDNRLPIWEVLHQLIRVFSTNGESGAAAVFAAVQSKAEAARQLAYRLYTLCERKNWAEDARAYNEVVTSWAGIESAAAQEPGFVQRELFDN
jgi:putative DNA methylase